MEVEAPRYPRNWKTRSNVVAECHLSGVKIPMSHLQIASDATNMAIEKVLPKRRDVLTRKADGWVAHSLPRMMTGAVRDQSW